MIGTKNKTGIGTPRDEMGRLCERGRYITVCELSQRTETSPSRLFSLTREPREQKQTGRRYWHFRH